MYTSIATLCDHAADYNGKLVISGTFDSILTRQLPVAQTCMFALRLHCTPEDNGPQTLNLSMVDDTDQPMGETINLEFSVEVPPEMGVSSRNLVLNMPLSFDRSGQFAVVVHGGGAAISRSPLTVVEVREEAPQENQEGEAPQGELEGEGPPAPEGE